MVLIEIAVHNNLVHVTIIIDNMIYDPYKMKITYK